MNDVAMGDEVYALTGFDCDGAAADYTDRSERGCRSQGSNPRPYRERHDSLAALTPWQALFDHGELRVGQRVLIHGAVGGVGSMAVQLAHGRGAYVIGTASTGRLDIARRLGADEAVDHKTMRFEDIADEVDLVFDTVSGEALERSPAVLRRGGRLISDRVQTVARPSRRARHCGHLLHRRTEPSPTHRDYEAGRQLRTAAHGRRSLRTERRTLRFCSKS